MNDTSTRPVLHWTLFLVISVCIAVLLLWWYNRSTLIDELPNRFVGTWNPKPDPMIEGHQILTISQDSIRHEAPGSFSDSFTWSIAAVEEQRGWHILTIQNTEGRVVTQYRIRSVENQDHILFETRWGASDPSRLYGDWTGEQTIYYRAPLNRQNGKANRVAESD